MASTASDQDAQDVKGLVDGLLLASSSMRKKLIGRLDARIERSPLLNHAGGHEAEGALVRAARDVHPDLEPVARHLGRLLALGPDALSAGQLRLLAQAGFQRTASRVGGLRERGAWIRGAGALTLPASGVRRRGRSLGVPSPACC